MQNTEFYDEFLSRTRLYLYIWKNNLWQVHVIYTEQIS